MAPPPPSPPPPFGPTPRRRPDSMLVVRRRRVRPPLRAASSSRPRRVSSSRPRRHQHRRHHEPRPRRARQRRAQLPQPTPNRAEHARTQSRHVQRTARARARVPGSEVTEPAVHMQVHDGVRGGSASTPVDRRGRGGSGPGGDDMPCTQSERRGLFAFGNNDQDSQDESLRHARDESDHETSDEERSDICSRFRAGTHTR